MIMGLSITFKQRKEFVCPKCGDVVGYMDLAEEYSSGRVWYPLLEEFGYYSDKENPDPNWYGKDMVLTDEQVERAMRFINTYGNIIYNSSGLRWIIPETKLMKYKVVINADW
jgi:hypothetical protein